MSRTMKSLLPVLLAAVGAMAVTQSNVNVGGRTVITYAPTGASSPALVISMHGMGIPASMNQGMMMFEKLANTAKFVDLRGNTVAIWKHGGEPSVTAAIPVGQLTRGVYMVEAKSLNGRATSGVLIP